MEQLCKYFRIPDTSLQFGGNVLAKLLTAKTGSVCWYKLALVWGLPTCTVARVVPGQNLQCRTLPPVCTICTVCWTLTAALQHFETLTVKIQKPRENGFYYRYQNDLSVILLYAIKFNLRNMLYCRKWPAKG